MRVSEAREGGGGEGKREAQSKIFPPETESLAPVYTCA